MIPNTDLVTTQVLPGANRQVIYTLAEDATYSDGVPVTCTDFLLHYKAGVHDGLFGAHLPQTDDVLRMECQPGAKRFTVVFKEDSGGRWRHLFGPGTVLPSHAIAERAGLGENELNTALHVDDMVTLGEVAPIWRDGFNLDAFDPQLQVSAGPFVIESVGESGEVVLAPNEHYYGDQPNLDTIVVWPRGTDAEHLAAEGALRIADVRTEQASWVNRDDPTNTLDIVEQIDLMEVFNPRVAISSFNEEAERFARKYNLIPAAGSDSHVAQGLGAVRNRLHDFDGPEEFLEAMREAEITRRHKNLVYVQALKFIQTTGRPKAAKREVDDPRAVRGGRRKSRAPRQIRAGRSSNGSKPAAGKS